MRLAAGNELVNGVTLMGSLKGVTGLGCPTGQGSGAELGSAAGGWDGHAALISRLFSYISEKRWSEGYMDLQM